MSEDQDAPPTVIGPAHLLLSDGPIEGWPDSVTVDGWPDLVTVLDPNAFVEGIIWIQVTISAQGELVATEVRRGFGGTLDESALRTVGRLSFAPALKAGEPVEGDIMVRVRYARD